MCLWMFGFTCGVWTTTKSQVTYRPLLGSYTSILELGFLGPNNKKYSSLKPNQHTHKHKHVCVFQRMEMDLEVLGPSTLLSRILDIVCINGLIAIQSHSLAANWHASKSICALCNRPFRWYPKIMGVRMSPVSERHWVKSWHAIVTQPKVLLENINSKEFRLANCLSNKIFLIATQSGERETCLESEDWRRPKRWANSPLLSAIGKRITIRYSPFTCHTVQSSLFLKKFSC